MEVEDGSNHKTEVARSEAPTSLRPTAPLGGKEPPFSWSTLKRLGLKYLGRFSALLVFYLITTLLTQSLIPVTVTLLSQNITNKYQHTGKAVAPAQSSAADSKKKSPSQNLSNIPVTKSEPLQLHLNVRALYFAWAGLLISMWGLILLNRYLQSYFDGAVAQSMRKDIFAAIVRQSPDFFIEYDKNRLNIIINQFTIQAQMGLRQLLVDPVVQLCSICFAGWALFGQIVLLHPDRQMWLMMGGIALFGLLAPWVTILMAKRLQRAASAVQEQNLRLGTLVGNALNSPEEIQAMQAETFFDQKHSRELDQVLRYRLQQTLTMERLNVLNKLPSDIVLITLMALLVFVLGAHGAIAPGTILALLLLTPQFMSQVQALSSYGINRNMLWPSIATVDEILSRKPEIIEGVGAKTIETIDGTLEAKNVVFSYRPGQTPAVLDGFSIKLPPQKWTGLVGLSGQGKSTFFRLVLRFFDFQAGEILVGGVSVREFTQTSLRRLVSLMVQSPAFFYDTLRENMRVARPDVTDDEIREACQMTCIWDVLVERLGPNTLDAELAGANMLSGGQKRRLALARGLLRKPSIIFLDEPTVGLAPADKLPLIPTLKTACEGKTVLLVEQDILWLEQICDYIFVLDRGRIVQHGTPGELCAQGGLYADLRNTNLEQNNTAKAPAKNLERLFLQETANRSLV
jgi:ATP-binding cassette subfamily B protein